MTYICFTPERPEPGLALLTLNRPDRLTSWNQGMRAVLAAGRSWR